MRWEECSPEEDFCYYMLNRVSHEVLLAGITYIACEWGSSDDEDLALNLKKIVPSCLQVYDESRYD